MIANRLVRDPEALPSSYEPTAAEMREQLSVARNLLASAPAQDEHTASTRRPETLAWNELRLARDNADQLLGTFGAHLDARQAKQPEHLAAAQPDLEERKTAPTHDVRFLDADIDQKVAHIDDYLAELHAEIEDEQVCADSTKQLDDELNRLLADILQVNDVNSLNALAEQELPALKAQLDLLKDKWPRPTTHVTVSSPIPPFIPSRRNANEADNERLLLVLNLQLEQVEQLPLDNVSVEQLDAIEKQLESLKPAGADQVPPQVQAQLDKIAELKARKDKHDADVAHLGAALDDIRKNLDEATSSPIPRNGKGKKGKEQSVPPTTDALKEVVAKLENEVLPALAQVNNQAASTPGVEPQLQAANELQAKAQELLADAQKQLDDQMAADEKAARVEAKLLGDQGDPRYHGRFATRRRATAGRSRRTAEARTGCRFGYWSAGGEAARDQPTSRQRRPQPRATQGARRRPRPTPRASPGQVAQIEGCAPRQMANLTKYGQEKQKLDSAAEPVEVALNTIFDKYANQAPQPFVVGKDDLSRADEVKSQLADLARSVAAAKEWLHDNLPSREADLDAQLDDLKWKQENLNSLVDELANEVQAGDAIRADYDQLLPLSPILRTGRWQLVRPEICPIRLR
ncbi:unnamed protein product, partial [Mesorhabditis spiculigera]